ncbi:MAG: hypothetical protein JNN18_09265 [Rubrivivax sp.]|nr:hypothetical protein [Rubrivivax sp.]
MGEGPEVQEPPKQQGQTKEYLFGLLKVRSLTEEEKRQLASRKQARKQHEQQTKVDKKQAKKEGKLEKERLLYEARVEQTKTALATLRSYRPAADDLTSEFETALDEAAVLAQDGKPAEALERLKKVDPAKAVQKADELWGKANEKARKLSPGGMEAVKQINQLLAGKDLPLPLGEVTAFRREQNLSGRRLLADKPSSDDVEQATQQLLDLQHRLEQRIADAGDQLRAIEQLHKQVRLELETVAPLSGKTPPLLTDRESAPMRLALDSARTSITARDYDAAAQTLQPLLVELQDVQQRVGPMRAQWLQAERDLPARLDEARKVAATAQAPHVRQAAIELRDRLQAVQTTGVGKSIGYPDALDRVGGAQASLQRLAEQEKAWLTFQGKPGGDPGGDDKLKQARLQVEQGFTAIDDALHRLHKAVNKQTGGKQSRQVADGPYAERRDAARQEWDARVAAAHDEGSLDAPGMLAKLDQIRQAIDAVVGNPQQLGTAIDEGKLARAKEVYATARQLAADACEQAVCVDAGKGSRLLEELEQIAEQAQATNTPEYYRFSAIGLNSLREKAARLETEANQGVEEARQELQKELEPMELQLAEIRRLADKAKSGEKQAPLVALLDTLRSQYDALRAMEKLTQAPLLRGARADAVKFALELESSVSAAKGEGGKVMSFAEVNKRIADLEVELADKTLKLYCVSTQFTLAEDLKALKSTMGTTTMSALTEKLNALTDRIHAAQRKAAQAKKATQEFEQGRVAELLQQLSNKAFDDAPKAKAALKARIKGLVADFQFEDGQAAAQGKADALKKEMTLLLQGELDDRGVPKALATQEASALKAENDKIVEKGKWEGQSKVLEQRLKELLQINPGEIKALQDMLDSAKTSVKKSEDYAGGREQLQAIKNRLSLIEANPRGLAITARNKLPQVNARYKRAVADFVRALGEVDQAVAKLASTDLDDPGKGLVSSQIAALRGLFNASAFEVAVATMTDKTLSREVRSGAREAGLREMRRLQSYLKDDFRLQTLAQSPFGPDMHSVQSELMLSLLDLENNLLVSL